MTRRTATLFAAVLTIAMAAAGPAEAGSKKKKKPAPAAKAAPKPTSEHAKALGSLAGIYKFGATKDEVLAVLDKQLTERYEEKIEATQDVYMQDKLRREKKALLKRVADSYIEFNGKKTGFDVSIIDTEFRQKTGESMMMLWEPTEGGADQRRFFFFHDGQLYKMFIALSSDGVADPTFAYFASLMEKRFGPGKMGLKTDKDGNQSPAFIEWNTDQIMVRAVDKLGFYGAFCLLIADQKGLRRVEKARADNPPPEKKKNAVMEAIVDDGSSGDPDIHGNADTIDTLVKSGGSGNKKP
jgi:hypothetical protein